MDALLVSGRMAIRSYSTRGTVVTVRRASALLFLRDFRYLDEEEDDAEYDSFVVVASERESALDVPCPARIAPSKTVTQLHFANSMCASVQQQKAFSLLVPQEMTGAIHSAVDQNRNSSPTFRSEEDCVEVDHALRMTVVVSDLVVMCCVCSSWNPLKGVSSEETSPEVAYRVVRRWARTNLSDPPPFPSLRDRRT